MGGSQRQMSKIKKLLSSLIHCCFGFLDIEIELFVYILELYLTFVSLNRTNILYYLFVQSFTVISLGQL